LAIVWKRWQRAIIALVYMDATQMGDRPPPSADQIISVLRAHDAELREAGIRHLSVFGSVARGDARDASDVDLAADLDPAAHVGLFRLMGLQRRLSEILDRTVDLLPEPVENPRLQDRINRDRRRAF
jgi:predicted nucleotidyltransferase